MMGCERLRLSSLLSRQLGTSSCLNFLLITVTLNVYTQAKVMCISLRIPNLCCTELQNSGSTGRWETHQNYVHTHTHVIFENFGSENEECACHVNMRTFSQ